MKKALKVLGAIVGGYAILNTLCLAWMGAGRVLRKFMENPTRSILESNEEVASDTVNDWKDWFKGLKGEA